MPRLTSCLRSTPRIPLRVRHLVRVLKMRSPHNTNGFLPFWVILCSKHQSAFSWTTSRKSKILGHIVRCTTFPAYICAQVLVLRRSRGDSHTVTKRFKPLPILGSVHSSDLTIIYGGGDLTDYLINFATNLNPNGASVANWPPYTNKSPQLLTLYDAPVPTNVTLDTYRAEGMKLLTEISLVNPA